MKYLPTIDLWNPAISSAIYNGQLKLQRGQWVTCGGAKPSRFVCMKGKSIWAAHPEGEAGTVNSFKRLCAIA